MMPVSDATKMSAYTPNLIPITALITSHPLDTAISYHNVLVDEGALDVLAWPSVQSFYLC